MRSHAAMAKLLATDIMLGAAMVACAYLCSVWAMIPDKFAVPLVLVVPLFAGMFAGRRGSRPVLKAMVAGAAGSSAALAADLIISGSSLSFDRQGLPVFVMFALALVLSACGGKVVSFDREPASNMRNDDHEST